MTSADRVLIFDTTLRDGEQSPGVSLNPQEKLEIARQLARLNVDIIEAGFPVTSEGDFQAVQSISRELKGVTIAALARTMKGDLDRAWDAIRNAEQPRIHTFISTSPIHMKDMLRMDEDRVMDISVEAVRHAARYTSDVEFSAQDATRSDTDFLVRLLTAVIDAGATTVNIPDTVGYTVPDEFERLVSTIRQRVPNIDRAVISVHCHNDLGLAVANSLSAVGAGARQVEVAVNGIGERAGNTALEEVVMALATRRDLFDTSTRIDTRQIYRTSRLVSQLSGMGVQRNKAIVGEHAFAHESGIHQDGVLKNPGTYEIMTPESIGFTTNRLVIGKHSGRHAFKNKLAELGYDAEGESLNQLFGRFKEIADRKKTVSDRDIEALVHDELFAAPDRCKLIHFHVSSGDSGLSTASVEIERDGVVAQEAAVGDGPVNALYRALNRAFAHDYTLKSYSLEAVTGGADALGEVRVQLVNENGSAVGSAVSPDILEASARAYISAASRLYAAEPRETAPVAVEGGQS